MKEFIKENWGRLASLVLIVAAWVYILNNPSPTKSDIHDVQNNQIEMARMQADALSRIEMRLKRIESHLEAKPLLPDVRLKEVKQ